MANELRIAGTSLIHTYNMLQNLERAYRADDQHFIKQWTPVFFGSLDNKTQASIDEAFSKGMMKIQQENESDAVLTW